MSYTTTGKRRDLVVSWVQKYGGVITMLAAVVLGALYYHQVRLESRLAHEDAVRAKCQSQYDTALAQQLIIRSRLFQAADDARDHLVRGVGDLVLLPPTKDAKELERRSTAYRSLFEIYGTESDRLLAERNSVKLPEIPNC